MSNKIWIGVALLAGITLGGIGGFFAGVASTEFGKDMIEGMAAQEVPADTSKLRTVDRKGFSLKYPANWSIDTKEDGYDPDIYFSINSPGSSYTTITLYDVELDARELVNEYVAAQANIIKNGVKKPFTQWGSYKGQGVDIKGDMLGINPGGHRVFVYTKASKTFVIAEQYYNDDAANTSPGFKAIESSFKLKS